MRITGGALKGRKVKAPKGRGTRPTTDMLRKAVFDVLGPKEVSKVLDLYAGSGAFGFEALSRGAEEVVLVEKDKRTAELIKKNAESLGVKDRVKVLSLDAKRAIRVLAEKGKAFDLIFMDPPYGDVQKLPQVLEEIILKEVLAKGGMLIIQHPSRQDPPQIEGLSLKKTKTYGDSALSFFIREV